MSDALILQALKSGQLRVNRETGEVFSSRSNTPTKPVGAITKKGYLRTCCCIAGKQVFVMVHRVVCIDTYGLPVGDKRQVNHKDTVKTNNRPDNLEWSTHLGNMAHAKEYGLHKGTGRKDGIRDNKGRFSKKATGRLLDGRTWDEFPFPKGAMAT